MNDFLDFYSRYLEALAKANALNKPIVFDALAALGLTLIEVEFDGEGDSGQIVGDIRLCRRCTRRAAGIDPDPAPGGAE